MHMRSTVCVAERGRREEGQLWEEGQQAPAEKSAREKEIEILPPPPLLVGVEWAMGVGDRLGMARAWRTTAYRCLT